MSSTTTIPQEFLDDARRLLGEVRFRRFEAALGESPSVSVRLNPLKCAAAGLRAADCAGYDAPVPWAAQGVYLKERPAFTFDPLLHAGVYYVQEASSMFLEAALRRYVTQPVAALDLCAAPGGKSTHARSLLPEGSFLVSNEPVRTRAQVLAENMTKWGHADVAVTNAYPADFGRLEDFFDLLLTDVPCSGEGMFRKEEDAVRDWSRAAVRMCRDRQREILTGVWPALKEGGLLVYSTCTLNHSEDEENVAWIARELGAEVLPLDVPREWGVAGNLLADSGVPTDEPAADAVPVYHFLQSEVRGEGFFLAVLRKTGGGTAVTCADAGRNAVPAGPKKNRRGAAAGREPQPPAQCRRWIERPERFCFRVQGDELTAVRTEWADAAEWLSRTLKVMQAGLTVARMKGRDWMPAHALALSTELCAAAFPQAELTYGQAVAYLRKETFALPPAVPAGYVLLTFGGVPLGFVKNLGNRFNNLYPQEWRIRSGYSVPFCLHPQLLPQ